MCVTDLGRVVAVTEDGGIAEIETDGRRRLVSLAVLVLEGTPVPPGAWLRVHTGLAVEVLDEAAAVDLADLRSFPPS